MGLFGAPALPVEATLACSGADALALCLGAVLAYPVTWRARLAGAAGGAALILGLNTLRIGTLGRAAASPAWFNALHLYVWPAVLTLAIAGYVFAWMRLADRRPPPDDSGSWPCRRQRRRRGWLRNRRGGSSSSRWPSCSCSSAASPLYLESPTVLALAGFIARAAAAILGAAGVSAHAAANVLWTPRGGFLVTQECIYHAADPGLSGRRLRLLGDLAAADRWACSPRCRSSSPWASCGCWSSRCLTRSASPLFLVHAFYQLLLGAVVVFLAALWRHGGRRGARPRAGRRRRGRAVRPAARAVLHARGHLSGRRAARRSAGSDRAPARVSGRPLSGAVGRGVRRRRLEALPRRARGARRSRRRPACWRCTPSPASPA